MELADLKVSGLYRCQGGGVMTEFNGIKLGELYSWTMAHTDNPVTGLFLCIDISKPRPYGKTGKMFSHITYLWNGRHHKTRTIEGQRTSLVAL